MNRTKILSESELHETISLNADSIECIESAFKTFAEGGVIMPPILSMSIEDRNGEVDVKTAYIPGRDAFAIKMSPAFFDNPKRGLPSTTGLMVLFSSTTGCVTAVLLDNGWLTAVRTAAAGAIAARYLSRDDSRSVCVIGAGQQARMQLEAVSLVRPIETATVWSRNDDEAERAARDLTARLAIDVSVARDLPDGVANADVVITATPSTTPLIESEWLVAGQHITAMGSDQPNKQELDPSCIVRADLYVPDRQSQTAVQGELHHAIDAGLVDSRRQYAELGDVVAGRSEGRTSANQITIADLTGLGLQDTAIAILAYELCR